MDASTPEDNTLHNKYPPTIEINVGNGPILASVYCAKPPVVFGINAFNSERDAIVVILSKQAITIATIKITPMVPAPCPSETRQLVAMTKPTETDMTLLNPSFFSSAIVPPPFYRASTPSSPVLTLTTLSIP